MMEHYTIEEGFHKELYYQYFACTAPKATLLVLHGMQEHCLRYEALAHFFAQKGYATLIYDHLGHGRSVQSEQDLGFFTLDNPQTRLIDDARHMAAFLKQKAPDVSCFALGHSMGSFVLRALLQGHWQLFAGAVLVGSGAAPLGLAPLKGLLACCNRIVPRAKVLLFEKIFGLLYNSRFKGEEGYDATSWLSKNTANRKNFKADPLCGIPFACNAYYALLCLVEAATHQHWAIAIGRSFPFVFVSGIDDPVGDFSKGVKSTADALQQAGFHQVSVKLYEGMRHEILQEQCQEQVYEYLYRTLEKIREN